MNSYRNFVSWDKENEHRETRVCNPALRSEAQLNEG
jgi:hypothetical protein